MQGLTTAPEVLRLHLRTVRVRVRHCTVFKRDSIDQSLRPAREKLSGSSGEHPGAGGFVKTLMIRNQLLESLHLGSYLQSGAIRRNQAQSGSFRCTQVHSGALRCTQVHSDALQMQSGALNCIRCVPRRRGSAPPTVQSSAISCNPLQSVAIRCNQVRTSAPWQRASSCDGTGTRSVAMQLGEI
jgi:hypothetical protein